MKRRSLIKAFTLSASIAAMGMTWTVQAAETIKVGILHSLSGTMAISETSLKDMALMTIDEINAKGGVNGKMLEPVVVDPASNWPLFAEKGRQLLTQDKVAVVFGCWTSVSRKSVLPVFEELNGLLFYPVQYEGEEMSPNVFYTAAPSVTSCSAPTTSTRAPPTKSCVRSCIPKAWRTRTSKRSTPRSAMPITRPSSPTSKNSRPAARRRLSPRSTATPTCRSIKSWPTRA
jgi:hypothetical protein